MNLVSILPQFKHYWDASITINCTYSLLPSYRKLPCPSIIQKGLARKLWKNKDSYVLKKTKTFQETERKHLLTLDSASESITATFSSSDLYSQEKKTEL